MIVASPAYAEPSSSQKDVFFGRWQATPKPSDYTITTPPASIHEEIDCRNTKNKLIYQTADPDQGFPSPESTNYALKSMPWGNRNGEIVSSSRSSVSSLWPSVTASSQLSSPSTFVHPTPLEDPPSSLHIPPPSSSLANYHTCSDNHQHKYNRLPTPPVSITDIHQKATGNHAWGIQLPPLKAIMNHLPQPSLIPLLLPPPPTMIDNQQYQYK